MALLSQAFLVTPFRIPTPSMVDTLRPGDRVLVNRVMYHLRRLQRGDIVVFEYPRNRDVMFIKRVIGLPGDTLETRAGTTMREPWSLADPYTVGKDEYFVVGDNRTRSDDSRVWGTVPAANIIGAGFLTYWPLGRLGTL